MRVEVERCDECGKFVYRLRLWISGDDILIDAGTRKAFVVDDLEPADELHGIPLLRLTEEVPAEVFVKHECRVDRK